MKHPFLIFLLFLCGGFSAVAQPSGNPLVFGENRLTLITPTLFRLEFAHDGKFIDDPTYFAYDRGSLLPASEFRVRELGGNRYEISTSALRIVYEHDGFPFGLHNFAAYYKLNGKEKKFTNRCIFRNNLGGPVETLDRVTGEIPMQDGLLSRDGWYVIDAPTCWSTAGFARAIRKAMCRISTVSSTATTTRPPLPTWAPSAAAFP